MLIYIRHSIDEITNSHHQHDNKLTDDGIELAMKEGSKLIDKYGIPDIIYCSPFRRTIQTMNSMLNNKKPDQTKIIYDKRAGRFFNSIERYDPRVSRKTYRFNILTDEDYPEFIRRVSKFRRKLHSYSESKKIVWCITHAMVFKEIGNYYQISLPKRIPFMEYFQVENKCHRCGSKINM